MENGALSLCCLNAETYGRLNAETYVFIAKRDYPFDAPTLPTF